MKLYLFVALISKILGTLIPPVYNFGNQQNYEIDLLYNHLLGRNIYFPDNPTDTKTQFIVTIYPSLSLELKFKFYTGNSDITQALNSGKYVYFGLDLNITNTDKSLEKYNTDVIACEMTKSDAVCYDYVYDKTDSKYKRNQNLSKNNSILIIIIQFLLLKNIQKISIISLCLIGSITLVVTWSIIFQPFME